MRCNNCGWDNDPGSSNCVKCGHSLSGGNAGGGHPYQGVNVPDYSQDGGARAPRPTVIGTDAIRREIQERAPRPTVMSPGYGGGAPAEPRPTVMSPGSGGGAPAQKVPRPTVAMTGVGRGHAEEEPAPASAAKSAASQPLCPHCGFVLVGDFACCPNCGATLINQSPAKEEPVIQTTVKEQVTCPKCHSEVSSKFAFCPMCGERLVQEQPVAKGPQCSLTMIPDEDEDDIATTNNYEGETIVLNRDNTEPSNRTITSKEQAVLICEEGKWYIENRSEQCSTYLEANRRLEVLPGDVIMLGDRRFKFNAELNQA